MLPGIWDIVGGHLEAGETPEQALAREVEEETGWRVRKIVATVTDWEWEWQGRVRRELDYLVTVDGDLTRPRLEDGKHDASAWVGPDDLDLLMVNRTDGDRRLRDIVAHTVRTRFTERLRLVPIAGPGEVLPGHVADLERLHADPWVAEWYAGAWSTEESVRRAAEYQSRWEANGVSKWMAYEHSTGVLVGRGGLDRLGADDGHAVRSRTCSPTTAGGCPTGWSWAGRCWARPWQRLRHGNRPAVRLTMPSKPWPLAR